MFMKFEKETMVKLFAAVNIEALDTEAKDAYEQLKVLCGVSTADDQTDKKCIDLYNLSLYESALLWEGDADVANILDSGMFGDLKILNEDRRNELIRTVSDRIDWNQDEFCGAEAGNEVISDEIEKYLKENGITPTLEE